MVNLASNASRVGRLPRRAAVAVVAVLSLISPFVSRAGNGGEVQIVVLSNRADLISGGDALVEIIVPDGVDFADVSVDVDGNDVTGAFNATSDGRFMGRLENLVEGENVVTAVLPDSSGATITIKNHSINGPVFSGPHVKPWICTTASAGLGQPGPQCSAPTLVQYFYQSTSSTSFAAYNPDNPPSNVRMITTDHGETVPYIIRQETGAQNRGIFRLAVLHDPSQPFEPWDKYRGWNSKLYYPFGASCGTQYTQGSAQGVQNNDALSRGFMVATSSLNVLGNNCNTVLSAETMMMLKEHIVDNFGEIRYTFGNGASGGSIGQHMVANSYPGLLQGLTVGSAFADTLTTGAEVFDCHLLFSYAVRNPWALAAWPSVTGSGASPGTCVGWEAFFASVLNPTTGCSAPADQGGVYHPTNNPAGARCTYQDFERNVWGLRDDLPERWLAPEQQRVALIGESFARYLYNNAGVQYGLKALQQGLITTEQFVHLNEAIGSFDVDFNLIPQRTKSDPNVPNIAYRSGRINDGAQLDQVAIIDTRGTGNVDPLLIHTMHHSFALKERIAKQHGHALNHVVWRGLSPSGGAFDIMDQWLSGVEADFEAGTLPEKIVRNRPAEARDSCTIGVTRVYDKAQCDLVWPYFGSPRIAAGGPTSHDLYQCTLKPLDRNDPDYGVVPFADLQWDRLQAAFPDGVCDWSQPSEGLTTSVPWLTYADGPGGVPLGSAPQSEPI